MATVKVQAIVNRDLQKWLAKQARKEDRTVSKVIERALEEYRARVDPVTLETATSN
jgi:predicted transcriptional regulator